jgi:hypothetical protein
MTANIALNSGTIPAGTVTAAEYNWGEDASGVGATPVDCVLGTDVGNGMAPLLPALAATPVASFCTPNPAPSFSSAL